MAEPGAWTGYDRGSPGYRRVLLALLCAGVATFAQLYSVQGVLPLMAADLGIDAAEASLGVSAATFGLEYRRIEGESDLGQVRKAKRRDDRAGAAALYDARIEALKAAE